MNTMKSHFFALTLAVLLGSTQGAMASVASSGYTDKNIVEHSGGCRKDSPQGQCCHAGSQPYHCH